MIKTVETATVPTAVSMRLDHEARLLERLDLGRTRRVLWCGQRDRFFYVVQPHVEGDPLDLVLATGRLTVPDALAPAGLLATLTAVHEVGVVHRDIKPSNVIVRREGTTLSAELVDFGLSRGGDLDREPAGTVRYIAPEAAGLITGLIDQRADLYSVGVVLFECLAGRPPFAGDSVGEVLRQHLNVAAPQLRSMGIAVPRSLEGVVQRLLAKDPAGRYQSAASAHSDIAAIAAAIAAGEAEPSVTPGSHDRRHVLAEPAFVGRNVEFRELVGVLGQDGASRRRLILVEAESGAGKTRLLDELALHAAQHDTLVLRGQGVDQAAPRPFQMLEGIVDGIVAGDLDAVLPGGLRAQLGDRADAAAATLPALTVLLGPVDTAGLGPEHYGETRSIEALLELFHVLGRAPRPVLVLLDDCQWADTMTLALLDRWHARGCPRTDATSSSSPPSDPRRCPRATCSALSTPRRRSPCARSGAPTSRHCASRWPGRPARSDHRRGAAGRRQPVHGVRRAARDGRDGGAPRHTRGLAGRGGPHGRRADLPPCRAVLSRRFDLLGPQALRFLEVGAVLGKEFDLDLAIALVGRPASDVAPALDDARRRRILWVREAEGRCSFTHDKLRENLLGRLQSAERRRLHLAAAERIEAVDPARSFDLAYHFDAAGEPAVPSPMRCRAAEQARSRHALDVAVTHYRIAPSAPSSLTRRCPPALAEGVGRHPHAARRLPGGGGAVQHALGPQPRPRGTGRPQRQAG